MRGFLLLPLLIICIQALPALAGDKADVPHENCPKAVELYNKGTLSKKTIEKESLFKEAITLCADQAVTSKAYNNLAYVYETNGEMLKALTNYRKAMEIKKDFVTPYVGVGDIFSRLGDHYSAYVMYENALKIDPEDKDAIHGKEETGEAFKKKMIVYFDRDSSKITDNYTYRLQVLGESARNGSKITITGFTCDIGSKSYNKRLSLRRAQSVASYFKSNYPIDSAKFVVRGKGKVAPLLPNSDEEARTLNRRVEIIIE